MLRTIFLLGVAFSTSASATFQPVEVGARTGDILTGAALTSYPNMSRPIFVSFSPRLIYYNNFLSDAEVEYFKHAATTLRGWNSSETGLVSVYFENDAIHNNPIVNTVEMRIAAVTGIAPHTDQEPLCIHRIVARPNDPNRVDEIHHDKVNKPFTTVTVLVYLSDAEEGGETIFPCHIDPETKTLCKDSFYGGARWHNGKRTVVEGQTHWQGQDKSSRRRSKVEKEMALLKRRANEFCAQEDNKSRVEEASLYDRPKGMKVSPKKGSAIIFWHDLPGQNGVGVGDALAWHTGCKVSKGVKWTMQKFSEVPRMSRARTSQRLP